MSEKKLTESEVMKIVEKQLKSLKPDDGLTDEERQEKLTQEAKARVNTNYDGGSGVKNKFALELPKDYMNSEAWLSRWMTGWSHSPDPNSYDQMTHYFFVQQALGKIPKYIKAVELITDEYGKYRFVFFCKKSDMGQAVVDLNEFKHTRIMKYNPQLWRKFKGWMKRTGVRLKIFGKAIWAAFSYLLLILKRKISF